MLGVSCLNKLDTMIKGTTTIGGKILAGEKLVNLANHYIAICQDFPHQELYLAY